MALNSPSSRILSPRLPEGATPGRLDLTCPFHKPSCCSKRRRTRLGEARPLPVARPLLSQRLPRACPAALIPGPSLGPRLLGIPAMSSLPVSMRKSLSLTSPCVSRLPLRGEGAEGKGETGVSAFT